ncbi:hypothetical protein Hanom_Chr04g00306931 [Helianthus anomalus]
MSKAERCGGATPATSPCIAPIWAPSSPSEEGAPWLGLHGGNAKVEAFRWGPLGLNQSNVFFNFV